MGSESGGQVPPRISAPSNENCDEDMVELRKSLGFFMQSFEKIMENPYVMKAMMIDNTKEGKRDAKENSEEGEQTSMAARVAGEARKDEEGYGPGLGGRNMEEARVVARKEDDARLGLGLNGRNTLDGAARDQLDTTGQGLLFGSIGQQNICKSPNKVSINNSINLGNNGLSYAKIVNQQPKVSNDPMVSLSDISEPIIRGEKIIVEIPDDLVDRCMANASFDLIGRIQYRKGENPLPLKDLKIKIQNFWKIEKDWKLAPIGRGFFYCRFSTNEDKMRAWATPWLKTNPGIFKLSKWVKDFNPYKYNATTTNVWVRMFGLSGEMFNPEVMVRIAKGVGTPILVDKASLNFDYAHFARVLVEVDLAEKLPTSVFISVKGTEKEIEIQFENLPTFCEHCHLIGHDKLDCRNLIRLWEEKRRNDEKHSRKRSRSRTRQVPINKNNPVGPVEKDKHVGPTEENKENGSDGIWVEANNNKKKNTKVAQELQKSNQGNIHTFNNFACLDNEDTNVLEDENMDNPKDEANGENVINVESEDNNIQTDVEMIEKERNNIVEEGQSIIGDNFNAKEGGKDANEVSPMGELKNTEKEVNAKEGENSNDLNKVENIDKTEKMDKIGGNLENFVVENESATPTHVSNTPAKSWADIEEEEVEENDEDDEDEDVLNIESKNGSEFLLTPDMSYAEILASLRKFALESKGDVRSMVTYLKKKANEKWRGRKKFHEFWMALEAVQLLEGSPSLKNSGGQKERQKRTTRKPARLMD